VDAESPTVFLDANILFSAAYDPDSRAAALLAAARAGRCAVVTSSYAVEEARRSLEKKRPDAVVSLGQHLQHFRIVPDAAPAHVQDAVTRHLVPVEDAPILAAALRAGAAYLVTGDRTHFGHLMDRPVKGLAVRVVSVANALRLFG
jgi:predicted nucleic acid-binding protein